MSQGMVRHGGDGQTARYEGAAEDSTCRLVREPQKTQHRDETGESGRHLGNYEQNMGGALRLGRKYRRMESVPVLVADLKVSE